MRKEELLKLNKKQLIAKCISMNAYYQKAMSKYRNLKGDILIIKNQILRIGNGIQFTTNTFGGSKANYSIRYYPSGKNNRTSKGSGVRVSQKCSSRKRYQRRKENESR